MKTKNRVVAAVSMICLMASSCASTHPGRMGSVEKGDHTQPIKLSAEKQKSFSDDHYTFFTFTVENLSGDMLRIKSTDLDMVDAPGGSSVLKSKKSIIKNSRRFCFYSGERVSVSEAA
jgi:hypothetical protein